MFSSIVSLFGWLPAPLYLIVSAIFTIFSIFVGVALIKVLYHIVQFLVSVTSGIFGKVASLFV